MDERECALLIATARGVGPRTAARLLRLFGSFARAVAAVEGRIPGGDAIPEWVRESVRDGLESGFAAVELERVRSAGARFATPGNPDYPGILSEIADAPVGIFVKGVTLSLLSPMIAVVGTRAPSPRGIAAARGLAGDLSMAGVTVVSGLARGVDTAAHRGALEAGGRTVAVLGTGLSHTYPPENEELAQEIARAGALVSEFPMSQDVHPGAFPRRNRIISGLSIGVVVVEAAERSGALITSARALEQGREVFAVPGPIDDVRSRGPHGLLKAGATLVEGAADILDELEAAWGPFSSCRGAATANAEPTEGSHGSRLADAVVSLLSLTPVGPDELAGATGAPVGEIAAALLELELSGKARPCPGGTYVLGERVAGRRPSGDARRDRGRSEDS